MRVYAEAAWPWVYHSDAGGVRISRMSGAAPPTPLAAADTVGIVETLVAEGAPDDDRVYSNVMDGPLTALDLRDAQAPRILARTYPPGNTTLEAARGGHLYLWDQGEAGWWFDASGTAGGAPATLAHGRAFLYATLPEGIMAFDLAASSPLTAGVKVFDWAFWLASDGQHLFRGLADGWEVYDVAGGPGAAALLATHRAPYQPAALRFSKGRGWTEGAGALHVLDLTDLAHPVEIAARTLPPTSRGWSAPAVAGTRAHYGGGDYGLWTLAYRPYAQWLPLVGAPHARDAKMIKNP